MERRNFLRIAALGGAALMLDGCRKQADNTCDTPAAPAGTMTTRTTPTTGDTVSLLGFGCMRLPTVGDGADAPIDQDEVNRQVDYALAHGVNYFDTSPAYCRGFSEAAMGEALSRHPRNSYFIATKLSNFAPSTWSYEESTAMFARSLEYLRTDYIDYLLLHAVGGGDDSMATLSGRYLDNGVLDFLKQKRADGTIRNLGFSFHGDPAVFEYLLAMHDRGEVQWDFVQIQLNYVDWQQSKKENRREIDTDWLYGELHRRGIPAVIMEPLLGGRLARVPRAVSSAMKARRPDNSLASWAFRFAGTPEGVLTVLSGMTSMDHLVENVATYSPLVPIDADEEAFLRNMALAIINDDSIGCTDCRYCMPCPYGVNIPQVFAHYNRCVLDGDIARADMPRDADYERARQAFLYGYDRSVLRLRQADHCIGCGTCLSHCPQHIDIPAQMNRIATYAAALREEAAADPT